MGLIQTLRSSIPGIRTWDLKRQERRRVAASQSYIESLRNIHSGRRGFVIGNGPSLKVDDLAQLTDEITIASNKIYLAFDQVKWRPTHYTICDRLVWDKIYAQLPDHDLQPVVPSHLPEKPIPHYAVQSLGNAADNFLKGHTDSFSADLTKGFYGGYSVTFENLQLAAYLGLNPIYLIGCDHYYDGEDDSVRAGQPMSNKSTANHFVPNYRQAGEKVNPAPIREMTIAYEVAARVAERSPFSIFNATRGGHLEAFPRVDFDTLFADPASDPN